MPLPIPTQRSDKRVTVVIWCKTFCWDHETYHGNYGYESFVYPQWPSNEQDLKPDWWKEDEAT
jgi:hypothetical protein